MFVPSFQRSPRYEASSLNFASFYELIHKSAQLSAKGRENVTTFQQ